VVPPTPVVLGSEENGDIGEVRRGEVSWFFSFYDAAVCLGCRGGVEMVPKTLMEGILGLEFARD